MNEKPIYKVVDYNNRVYLPKALREITDVKAGDIVKLFATEGKINVSKVTLVEMGDHSSEAVELFVESAIKFMSNNKKLELINQLSSLLKNCDDNLVNNSN